MWCIVMHGSIWRFSFCRQEQDAYIVRFWLAQFFALSCVRVNSYFLSYFVFLVGVVSCVGMLFRGVLPNDHFLRGVLQHFHGIAWNRWRALFGYLRGCRHYRKCHWDLGTCQTALTDNPRCFHVIGGRCVDGWLFYSGRGRCGKGTNCFLFQATAWCLPICNIVSAVGELKAKSHFEAQGRGKLYSYGDGVTVIYRDNYGTGRGGGVQFIFLRVDCEPVLGTTDFARSFLSDRLLFDYMKVYFRMTTCKYPRNDRGMAFSDVARRTGRRNCFGLGYSSDNSGDGPPMTTPLSGWGARKKSSRSQGKGWESILSNEAQSTDSYRDRLVESFSSLQSQAMASCHAPSTLRSYGSGWNSWARYCEFFSRSSWCKTVAGAPMSFQDIVKQIQDYIHFECAVRQVQPDSIKGVYLAGIADYYDRCGVMNRFREASGHNIVQLVLASYGRSWSKKHPDSSKVKIAFGLSYALHTEKLIQSGLLLVGGIVCSDCTDLVSYMIGVRVVTAIWMGIFFLLRKNEFLPRYDVGAGMQEPCRRQNLRFFDNHKMEIPYDRIGSQRAFSVSLTLRFSKTDQTGHGRIVQHEATQDPSTCIVRRLEEYFRVSRDYFKATSDSMLFTVPGLPTDLTSAVLTEVMRDTTNALGLPAESISAHSLRYGGATALSQAGFPEYIIAFYGGWAPGSVAMRRYIVQSASARQMVSTHMAQTAYASSVDELVRETLAGRIRQERVSIPSSGSRSGLEAVMGPNFALMPRKRQRRR